MKTISYKDFNELYKSDIYYKKIRWDYYKEVIDILEKENPKSVLELGCYKLPIVKDCETMDILKELNPTYVYDATKTPWPIKKHYDIFIALQTFEHLENKQRQVFKEIMRISDKAIISFPYLWKYDKADKEHYMIDKKKISYWTLGIKPVYEKLVNNRLVYLFNF